MNDVNQTILNSNEMEGKHLTFWTDGQLYGVPISEVVQIVGIQHITEVPEWPVYAKGIINLRGNMIPLIDMRIRLAKAEKEYNERGCVIVCSILDRQFGLIADEVDEVTEIPDERISSLPDMSSEFVNRYLTGIAQLSKESSSAGEKLILCLDISKVLGSEELPF